jgi:hypothetical protein
MAMKPIEPAERATLGTKILTIARRFIGGDTKNGDEEALRVFIPKFEELLGMPLSPDIASSVMEFWTFVERLEEPGLKRLHRRLGVLKQLAAGRPEFIAIAYQVSISFTTPLSHVMERIPLKTRLRDRLTQRLSGETAEARLSTMYAVTPCGDLDEAELKRQFAAHHLKLPSFEDLIAFVNANGRTIASEPLIAIVREHSGKGRRNKKRAHTYSVHRDAKGQLWLETHRRNFWLKRSARGAKRSEYATFLGVHGTTESGSPSQPPSS